MATGGAESSATSSAVHEADLTNGMEHLRPYVSIPLRNTSSPPVDEPTTYGVPSHLIEPARRPQNRPKSPSNTQKRTDPFQFGSRYLEEGDNIFEFNAWDHVEVDDAYKSFAELQYQRQREEPVTDRDKGLYNANPAKWWNKFYANNRSNFFKNRKWLFQEFPVLERVTAEGHVPTTILEVGAGAGNTAFPILAANKNKGLRIHACDYSAKAVELIRTNEAYDPTYIQADVWDVTATGDECLPDALTEGSVDVVILIFIFSALSPTQWSQALKNIWRILKPGGEVLFRDYGRGDLAQVRFKKGRYLEENFYVRGDGTRVYFFEKEELERIWRGVDEALMASDEPGSVLDKNNDKKTPEFEILNLAVDRRMLVNRQRRLKMYRCWMQGHFRKPPLKGKLDSIGANNLL